MNEPRGDERPSWEQYFMNIAYQVASRSTCMRREVGAVVVLEKRILTTGYNGAPSGLKHCAEVGCLREKYEVPSGQRHELCRGLHAEMNAMLQAAYHGVRIAGSTLYTTHVPCVLCTKMLINAGIERVIAGQEYPDDLSQQLLRETGITVDIHRSEEDKA